ncbi:MAG: hypothetical protein E7487_10175 [Ruminococcaceae bacterium]|nr:hypothetical protein [Oscillospiraceae bacterium]
MMTTEKHGLRAAYFGRNLTDDAAVTANAYVNEAANTLKLDGKIEQYMLFSCFDNEETQIIQMEEAAAKGFDVFLIDPCSSRVLACAAQLMAEQRILFAAEISDLYAHPSVLGISCSTTRSDQAAANYVCNKAANSGSPAAAIILTSPNSFGRAKRDIFLQTLEQYPEITVIADQQYTSVEEAASLLRNIYPAFAALEENTIPIILCDRLDSRLLLFILDLFPNLPMFALSDRIDFLTSLLQFAGDEGKVPFTFAAVNSAADLPSLALKIAVQAASGDSFAPDSVVNGQLLIDTYYLLTDEEFSASSSVLSTADETYIATGILHNPLSEIFD